MKSGVYKITNVINNKCYVGSSQNVLRRWSEHKRELLNNRHHSIILQRSYNKYGLTNFVFKVLEYCPIDTLVIREQYYLDILKPKYNILKFAGSALGHIVTEKTKLKMSLKKKGIKCSDLHRQNIAIGRSIPVDQVCLVTGKTLNSYNSIKEASELLKIDLSSIAKVLKGKRKYAGGFYWKIIK